MKYAVAEFVLASTLGLGIAYASVNLRQTQSDQSNAPIVPQRAPRESPLTKDPKFFPFVAPKRKTYFFTEEQTSTYMPPRG